MHCWKNYVEHIEELHGFGSDEWAEAFLKPATCMLPDGHEGPHEFTPDDEIGIVFSEATDA